MAVVDTHQHLWSAPLWEALGRRTQAPFVRPGRGDDWVLHLPAEPACSMPGPDDGEARLLALDRDGVDLALVAPSTALGLDWLPRDEAEPLLRAAAEGVAEAGPRFGRWASISLLDPRPEDLEDELAAGAAGLCVPSGALANAVALDRLGPVLETLARADAPLFVHPGPGPADLLRGDATRWSAEPWWWPGLTDYVAAMHRAWLVWAARGRREHPGLRVLWAMLAGLAPLQAERLAARGAPGLAERALADDRSWYETSSYGPVALAAVEAAVGTGRLVHGSDRPVVVADLPAPLLRDRATTNTSALLGKAAIPT